MKKVRKLKIDWVREPWEGFGIARATFYPNYDRRKGAIIVHFNLDFISEMGQDWLENYMRKIVRDYSEKDLDGPTTHARKAKNRKRRHDFLIHGKHGKHGAHAKRSRR